MRKLFKSPVADNKYHDANKTFMSTCFRSTTLFKISSRALNRTALKPEPLNPKVLSPEPSLKTSWRPGLFQRLVMSLQVRVYGLGDVGRPKACNKDPIRVIW